MKILFILFVFITTVFSEMNVYTSKKNSIDNVSKKDLSNIYLKKKTEINGKKINVVNNKDDYDEFNKKVLNKTPSQIHAYWMKQIFLGKKIPPKLVEKEKVDSEIKKDPNTIVYSSDNINEKVIHEVK